MTEIHLTPESAPSQNLPLQRQLLALFSLCVAMGALSGDDPVTALDAPAMRRLVGALQQAQLARTASVDLAPLLSADAAQLDAATAARMEAEVARLIEVLDHSPSPTTEWASMREVLGDDALCALVGVAPASMRRYAGGGRETPQAVAERLHWLATVVADLAGGYNAYGMRRWFERPRHQLGGLSPRLALGDAWGVDDEAAQRVRALAAALTGAQPLAA
jgi:hypothetical protein